MTFLIEYTLLVHKWQYVMTKRLKELYPSARFVALINASEFDKIKSYLTSEDIRFEEIINGREYRSRFQEQTDIDYDLLRRFEETLPHKSLWRLVIIDRDWGWSWVKTAVRPISYIHTISNRENIFKICQHMIKLNQRLFDQYQFDVVLPSNGMNSLDCAVMERFSKNYGAHYLVPETIRAMGHFSFATDLEQNFPHLYQEYIKILNDKSADISVGEKMYDEMMEDLSKEEYYDKITLKKFKATAKIKYLIKVPLKMIKATLDWFKSRPQRLQNNDIYRQPNTWPAFWSNVRYAAMRPYQVMKLMDPNFFSPFDPNCKYAYFPLSSTPEHSTQVKAPMWVNQALIIETLSKSLPFDWIIYVKEHPQNLLCRLREFKFYEELKRYPNVRIIPTDTNFFEVIKKAQLVVNITGTTGWQAIQFNKPVMNFGDNFYDMLGLSVRCSDIEKLPQAIRKAVEICNCTPLSERRHRISCLLTVMRRHSFWVDHPWKVQGDIVANDADSKEIGLKVADCLHHYLSDMDVKMKTEKMVNV
jgi:hypothetical protein